LRANDNNFKPTVDAIGKSLVTELHDIDGAQAKFTDVKTDDKYFIIAAPST